MTVRIEITKPLGVHQHRGKHHVHGLADADVVLAGKGVGDVEEAVVGADDLGDEAAGALPIPTEGIGDGPVERM
jgi:hypothetical protein